MAISLSSAARDFSVLRGPWPGDRQAGWRRGSQERKIGAGGTRLVYFIIGESCATRSAMPGTSAFTGKIGMSAWTAQFVALADAYPGLEIDQIVRYANLYTKW